MNTLIMRLGWQAWNIYAVQYITALTNEAGMMVDELEMALCYVPF